MIKIKASLLFAVENNSIILDKLNPELETFLNYPYRNGCLKYDIQNKIGTVILRELFNINEFRRKLYSECREENDECNKQLFELLNSEIELEVKPVSLTRLVEEECSGFNFALLDRFICDDRISKD